MGKNKIPISETHKELVNTEWDYKKNNKLGLYPTKLTYGSQKKVWWICKKGHEWKDTIGHRCTEGRGCPYCAGQKVCKDNCLLTKNLEISREWHPTKNKKLTPQNITCNSNKKVWWICNKGHEWETRVADRYVKNSKCPYCAGRKICKDNCLSTTHPEFLKEWNYIKNNKLTPEDISYGSNKKVWWICNKGHKWKASCHSKIAGNGCPYCTGQKVCKDNCLLTTHPELAKEWHLTKNGKLTPKNTTHGSDKKVWWICKKGHEWKTTIGHRCIDSQGCPKCAIINVTGKNNPRYNHNLTDEDRIDRRLIPENREWRKKVYTRDYWTCQICGRKNIAINAHHLMAYNKYPKLRFKITNGITLCAECHKDFHKIYGRGNNTLQQFEEYKKYRNNNILVASA